MFLDQSEIVNDPAPTLPRIKRKSETAKDAKDPAKFAKETQGQMLRMAL